jgi:hypothetical protein
MNFSNLHREEVDHLFRCFCSYICICFNKKYNLANILLLYLQDLRVKNLFKSIMDVEDDVSAVRIFLEFDPTLCKSKYIMKYLNHRKK